MHGERQVVRHAELVGRLALTSYFCDRHSPSQEGSIENANGVRRFLPREAEPAALARACLGRLADRLNDTP
jgi:IS30 family transposase